MNKLRIGINGFGRIGRMVFRAAQRMTNVEVVAVNDLLDTDQLAYLVQHDSTHGMFHGSIKASGQSIVVNDTHCVQVYSERSPIDIPWGKHDVDVVVESTGIFLTRALAEEHIRAGAKNVVLSAPPKDQTPMFVMGVNHEAYNGESIVSNASCTTNCVAPLAKVLHDEWTIVEGLMTTVHATTASQQPIDGASGKDWRAGRGAHQNIIPASTGAAKAVGKVIPSLDGKLTGVAFRVPVPNVSVVDLTVRLKNPTSYENICKVIKNAANGKMRGILGHTDHPLVSNDFIGNTHTSIFDVGAGVELNNKFFKLVSWYDNEAAYAQKTLDLANHIFEQNNNIHHSKNSNSNHCAA